MSNYHAKYLKYKQKYLDLKQLGSGMQSYVDDRKKVTFNIIVDVQNCFMMGGSFITNNEYDKNQLYQKDSNGTSVFSKQNDIKLNI